jgi:hypothetical protein
MEILVAIAIALLLVVLVHASFDGQTTRRVLPVLLAAFAMRLLIHVLLLRTHIIQYGGDNYTYQSRAVDIISYWQTHGFRFVTGDQVPSVHSVAIPCNVFAIVMLICGDSAPLACTAVVALVACMLGVVLYKFALLLGADDRAAFRVMILVMFLPAFLVHTSDTYKDGFNAFLVVACLWLAAANTRRFDLGKVVLLAVLLWALWHVRPYMVFMCALPLLLGLLNISRSRLAEIVIIGLALLAPVGLLAASSGTGGPVTSMLAQLERGQAENVRNANASDDSGVTFQDGGDAWAALLPKVLYTLFSPFPWSEGSFTLQLGKIEALMLYYLMFCAVLGARQLWRRDRRMLLFLLMFIVPSVIVYATTMANVGLIFRQRMPILLIIALLAALAWTRRAEPRRRTGALTGPQPAQGAMRSPASPSSG